MMNTYNLKNLQPGICFPPNLLNMHLLTKLPNISLPPNPQFQTIFAPYAGKQNSGFSYLGMQAELFRNFHLVQNAGK